MGESKSIEREREKVKDKISTMSHKPSRLLLQPIAVQSLNHTSSLSKCHCMIICSLTITEKEERRRVPVSITYLQYFTLVSSHSFFSLID